MTTNEVTSPNWKRKTLNFVLIYSFFDSQSLGMTTAISAMILAEKKGFGTSFPNYLKLPEGLTNFNRFRV
jgi:hypothetical protein